MHPVTASISVKFWEIKEDIGISVPDHVGTLAQVGNGPNLGWPNKELRGSQPI